MNYKIEKYYFDVTDSEPKIRAKEGRKLNHLFRFKKIPETLWEEIVCFFYPFAMHTEYSWQDSYLVRTKFKTLSKANDYYCKYLRKESKVVIPCSELFIPNCSHKKVEKCF